VKIESDQYKMERVLELVRSGVSLFEARKIVYEKSKLSTKMLYHKKHPEARYIVRRRSKL